MNLIKNSIISAILATASIGLFSHANAQNKTDDCKYGCLNLHINGLSDNDKSAKFRSESFGAGAQHISNNITDLKTLQIEEQTMAQDINNTIRHIAIFFKNKTELKGILELQLTYFPGYKTPFQYTDEDAKEINQPISVKNETNKFIKDNSSCNPQGFCYFFTISSYKYIDEDLKDELNDEAFRAHMQNVPSLNLKYFHNAKNKKDLTTQTFYILLGTNGKLISNDEANIVFQN